MSQNSCYMVPGATFCHFHFPSLQGDRGPHLTAFLGHPGASTTNKTSICSAIFVEHKHMTERLTDTPSYGNISCNSSHLEYLMQPNYIISWLASKRRFADAITNDIIISYKTKKQITRQLMLYCHLRLHIYPVRNFQHTQRRHQSKPHRLTMHKIHRSKYLAELWKTKPYCHWDWVAIGLEPFCQVQPVTWVSADCCYLRPATSTTETINMSNSNSK